MHGVSSLSVLSSLLLLCQRRFSRMGKQLFVHRCSRAGCVLVQRNQEINSGSKCRRKNPPVSQIQLTDFYVQLQTSWSHDQTVQGPCHTHSVVTNVSVWDKMKYPCWKPANVKSALRDTQLWSNVWICMPEHCILTCCLLLEREGDSQCDLLLLTTESFLPADRGLHGGGSACFGSATSRRRTLLHPDRGNLDSTVD